MVFHHILSSAVIAAGLLYLAVAAYGYWLEQRVVKNELSSRDITVAKWVIAIFGILLLLCLLALLRDRKSVLSTAAILIASILGAVLAFYIFSILQRQAEPGSLYKLVELKKWLISSMVIAVIIIAVGLYCISMKGEGSYVHHRRSSSARRSPSRK